MFPDELYSDRNIEENYLDSHIYEFKQFEIWLQYPIINCRNFMDVETSVDVVQCDHDTGFHIDMGF